MTALHSYWGFYILGQVMHLLMRNHTIAQKAKRHIWDALQQNWPIIMTRLFLCTLIFISWTENGWVVNQLFHHLPQKMQSGIPLTRATAGLYGYFSDSLVAFILDKLSIQFPSLRTELSTLETDTTTPPAEAKA